MTRLAPVHPGEVLQEEFLWPLGLSPDALAERIGVPVEQVSMIIATEDRVTVDIAFRLSKVFGTTMLFWLNLQETWETSGEAPRS